MLQRRLTEIHRRRLAVVAVTVEHYLLLPPCLYLLGTSFYLVYVLDDTLKLVDDLPTAPLPCLLFITGVVNLLCNWNLLRVMARAHRPSTRVDVLATAWVAELLMLLATILVFCSSIFYFVQWSRLGTLFQSGLTGSMRRYMLDGDIKARLDQMQMDFSCCGDTDFSDWFLVPWIPTDILLPHPNLLQSKLLPVVSADSTEYRYLTDDVPFSCCNPSSPRPCIHHHVTMDDLHYNYNHFDYVTLHRQGCRQALMDLLAMSILCPLAISQFVVTLFQVALIVVCRLALTSMQAAMESGNVEATAEGHVFRVRDHKQRSAAKSTDLEDYEDSPSYAEKWALLSDSGGENDEHVYAEIDEPIDSSTTTAPGSVARDKSGEPIYENVIPEHLHLHKPQSRIQNRPATPVHEHLFPSEMAEMNNASNSMNHMSPPTRRTSKGFQSLGIRLP